MIHLSVARLRFLSPIHLSKGRLDPEASSDIIHSDTLKSAIISAGVELYGDKIDPEELLRGFTVSSAFPFFKDEYFFPKPLAELSFDLADVQEKAKKAKQLKKLTYIGKEYYEKLLAGLNLKIPSRDLLEKGAFLSSHLNQDEIHLKGTPSHIMARELQQRVSIPGSYQNLDPTTFYVERIYFHPEGGLFCLFHGLEGKLKKMVANILHYLGEKGIGKNRNLGFGQFDFHGFETLKLNVPDNCQNWTNLSVYCPDSKQELTSGLKENAAYSLIKRGGWVSSPSNEDYIGIRKKSVQMFQEGGVFNFEGQETNITCKGKCVDLTPHYITEKEKNLLAHHRNPIWRDGKSIFLPINLNS